MQLKFESSQRFAKQIEIQLAATGPSSEVMIGRKILEYGRKVECFRKGVEHFEKLLGNALHVAIHLQAEVMMVSNSAISSPARLLPFDPVTLQESMGDLLDYLELPRWLCDCRVTTVSNSLLLQSHQDLLLLAVGAVLTHLVSISSWSIHSITTYQSSSESQDKPELVVDIICGGGGIGNASNDFIIDERSLVSVQQMLSCVHGSLQVVPGLGLHRIILPFQHAQSRILCAPAVLKYIRPLPIGVGHVDKVKIIGGGYDDRVSINCKITATVKSVAIIHNNYSHSEESSCSDESDTQLCNKHRSRNRVLMSRHNTAMEASKSLLAKLTRVTRTTNVGKVLPV